MTYPGFQRIFFSDTDISQQSRVNEAQSAEEKKTNLWSQEHANSFPCEKSVQKLNWVTDWILPCPQGINNITMALIGYIEQLHGAGFSKGRSSRSKTTCQQRKKILNFSHSFRNAVHHALSSKFENVRQLKPV